jgi:hypothetical protein
MNSRNITERFFRAAAIGATILAFSQPAVASEAMRNVSKELSDMQNSIVSAEVYTLPESFSFRIRQQEENVVASGCRYSVVEKDDLVGLLKVLEGASLHELPNDRGEFDARTVVYLRTQGGTIPLVLTREYSNAPAFGAYNGRVPVESAVGFGRDFRIWKSQRKPINSASFMCQD